MFINNIFYDCKNMINKLLACIIACSIICQSFLFFSNINSGNLADVNNDILVQNDIFSVVFVVEKTINNLACSITGNIFQQNSNKQDNTNKSSVPTNMNELSILSVPQFNEIFNLQFSVSSCLNNVILYVLNYQIDIGRIYCLGDFTVYFLEMLRKSSFSSMYGDGNIINVIYKNYLINPA